MSFCRSSIQAFGFVWIKLARDPLNGIQKMDYMNLVSNIQKLNPKYIYNMIQSIQWK